MTLGQIRFVRWFDFGERNNLENSVFKGFSRCSGVIHKHMCQGRGVRLNPVIHVLSLPATLDISHLSRPNRGELDQVLRGI